MLKVTFSSYAPTLKQWFTNVEYHRSLLDAKLRASALGWIIVEIEQAAGPVYAVFRMTTLK